MKNLNNILSNEPLMYGAIAICGMIWAKVVWAYLPYAVVLFLLHSAK